MNHSLLDQGPVLFPFDQDLRQEHDQIFSLLGIMTAFPEVLQQVLLIAQTLPAFLDVTVGFEQERFLCLELFGSIGEGRHGTPPICRVSETSSPMIVA